MARSRNCQDASPISRGRGYGDARVVVVGMVMPVLMPMVVRVVMRVLAVVMTMVMVVLV